MNVAQLKQFCRSFPQAMETFCGEPYNFLVCSVGGRKFAYFKTSEPERWRFSMRVAPERFLELTDVPGVKPALERGATSIEPPLDTPDGDHRCMIKDNWGNTWQIASRRYIMRSPTLQPDVPVHAIFCDARLVDAPVTFDVRAGNPSTCDGQVSNRTHSGRDRP